MSWHRTGGECSTAVARTPLEYGLRSHNDSEKGSPMNSRNKFDTKYTNKQLMEKTRNKKLEKKAN